MSKNIKTRRPLQEVIKSNISLKPGQSKMIERRLMGITTANTLHSRCEIRPIYKEHWIFRSKRGEFREETKLVYGYDVNLS